MKRIIQIDGNKVFIGTETNEIISTVLEAVNYENPKVGDEVEVYKDGDDIVVIKVEEHTSEKETVYNAQTNVPSNKSVKNGNKKWFIIIGAVIIAILLIGVLSQIGDNTETYEWPNDALAEMLPEPKGKIVSLSEVDGEFLDATVEIKEGYCIDYIDACREKGFTLEKSLNNYDGDYDYRAKNKEGWEVWIYNTENEMYINLTSPEWIEEDESSSDEEESTDNSEEEESKELVDGMRPEFKKAMDSYEAFYNEYCDFMESYDEDTTDLELISKYSDLMSKASEMDADFEKWDDDDLNDAELDYYLEVTSRVSEKLLETAN